MTWFIRLVLGWGMNVKLLKQVRDFIGTHPEQFNQENWCGSACCVAGHAVKLAGGIPHTHNADTVAQELLKLSDDQAARLFNATWYRIAGGKFTVNHDTMSPEECSKRAVKRINHFIKTGGAE